MIEGHVNHARVHLKLNSFRSARNVNSCTSDIERAKHPKEDGYAAKNRGDANQGTYRILDCFSTNAWCHTLVNEFGIPGTLEVAANADNQAVVAIDCPCDCGATTTRLH